MMWRIEMIIKAEIVNLIARVLFNSWTKSVPSHYKFDGKSSIDKRLRKQFTSEAEDVVNFLINKYPEIIIK